MREDNKGSGSRRSIGIRKTLEIGQKIRMRGAQAVDALREAAIFAGTDKSDLGATLEKSYRGYVFQSNAQENHSEKFETFLGDW